MFIIIEAFFLLTIIWLIANIILFFFDKTRSAFGTGFFWLYDYWVREIAKKDKKGDSK